MILPCTWKVSKKIKTLFNGFFYDLLVHHHYKDVRVITKEKFMGEDAERYEKKFEICTDCGRCIFRWSVGYDSGFDVLNESRSKILREKVKDGGKYFYVYKEEFKDA